MKFNISKRKWTKALFTIHFPLLISVALLVSCSDFFDPSTDDELAGDEYISSQTEMYTGFLGIMTKMQAVGDKEILLTETRGELIEVTDNPTPELQAVYNYEPNLQGNPYANPAGYYEVIIACNDYIEKMKEFRSNPVVTDEVYKPLVASAVRIKIWAYKTLAEIYGQAVWFDDPVSGIADIKGNGKFQLMQLPELVDKCLSTLETGVDGAEATDEIDWIAWLDPANVTNVAGSQYRKWTYTVPPYAGLHAELCLWKGAVMDAAQQDAKNYYKTAADELLKALNEQIDITADPGSNVYWLPGGATPGHYTANWNYNGKVPGPYDTVSAIIYDYTNNQTNSLLKHLSNEFPNEYLLRPSEVGINRFLDKDFNPGSSTNDTRYKACFGTSSGVPYFAKFRTTGSSVRPNAYEDDCHIFLYRATQYHMMLAEALNHLGRFYAMNGVFNVGVKAGELEECFKAGTEEWEGFESKYDPTLCDWTGTANWGTRKYPSMGVRGCYSLPAREISMDRININNTYRINDMAMLDEVILEFAGEGKVYPWMNRMAVRYNDPRIIADRVCPKYEAVGTDGEIRAKIMAGGYWVPYNLGVE
ncbi:MAG: hypothetical protein IJ144_05080 [Prevotella sp.]|nr:hypothetical protein [Prevotella sp.]MBQ9187184.1 hypothetical protein [Prevotella sp.]